MADFTLRCVHGFASGLVQGVNFRRSMQTEALRLGLAGWVRNLPDRRVEFLAQGNPADVERLLGWARRGPDFARVADLAVSERVPAPGLSEFAVLPTPR